MTHCMQEGTSGGRLDFTLTNGYCLAVGGTHRWRTPEAPPAASTTETTMESTSWPQGQGHHHHPSPMKQLAEVWSGGATLYRSTRAWPLDLCERLRASWIGRATGFVRTYTINGNWEVLPLPRGLFKWATQAEVIAEAGTWPPDDLANAGLPSQIQPDDLCRPSVPCWVARLSICSGSRRAANFSTMSRSKAWSP